MKRKLLSILLASLMGLSLVACGGSAAEDTAATADTAPATTTEEKTDAATTDTADTAAADTATAGGAYDPATAGDYTIGFAWWGNQLRDEVTMNAAEHFSELYPNISFNLNNQVWNDYWTIMTTASSSGELPDLMQQDYAYLEQWAEAGALLDLTPYIESGALDVSNISESIVGTGKANDGGIYAVCAGENAPALSYNKTLTDELGITVPDNMTWDEFADISRQIYEETGIGVLYGNGNSENPLTYYARGLGHQAFFGEEGLEVTAEEMTGYYQRLMDGVAEGWLFDTDKCASVDTATIEGNPLVYGTDNSVRSWCAFAFSNQYAALSAAAAANEIELGICSWAENNPSSANYLKPGQFFSVTTNAQNPDLAVAFLNYLINDVDANTLLLAERGVPASSVVAAAIKDAVSERDATYPIIVDYLDMVANNSSPIFGSLPGYAGTVNTDVIEWLSWEALDPNTSYTAAELAQELVDGAAQVAASY
ncbi:MAG: extracellular solute-binding protein [Lachnospiraceae bacterium]|nr:extracellular solute-binding protein [Lachnospiraceae bacterium]